LVNLPFFALAIWKKGWGFTLRTLLAVSVVGVLADFNEAMLGLHDLPILYGVPTGSVIAGVGILILFRHGASLGGFNILALILQERAGLNAGSVLMALDAVIVLAS
ncbi:YitT family protein, partial [Brevibacterium paucivorans]